MCPLYRGYFAPPGSSAKAQMGADVETDCRKGTNEHAVHFLGRPGKTHTHTVIAHITIVSFKLGKQLYLKVVFSDLHS